MLIVRDIVIHASVRKLEWLMTGLMIHLGWIFFWANGAFNESPTFAYLSSYMSEHSWALVFLVFGFVRLGVLIVNGTHIRSSAELRMLLAAVSFVILCIWIWGIQSGGATITNAASYKWLAIGELLNVWQASSDLDTKRRSLKANGSGNPSMG